MSRTDTAPPAEPVGDAELFDQVVEAPDAKSFDEAPVAEPPPAAEPTLSPEAEKQRIPLSDFLDERERRMALEKRLAKFEEAERRQTQQPIDPILRPDEYFDKRFNEQLDPIRRAITMQLMNANKQLASATHGAELVEEAQAAFDNEIQQGRLHPADYQRIWSSPNPFAAAVDWHNNRKMMHEVGNDPKAYRDRLAQELLADPEFLGRAIEAARAHASGRPVTLPPRAAAQRLAPPAARQPGKAPLPPSLNRQGPPGGQPPPTGDMADEDLYDEMTNPAKLTE